MISTKKDKLIRLGQIKAECDEAFMCISHGLPMPCDICDAESDDHAPHAAKCSKCGYSNRSSRGYLSGKKHPCHSIEKYDETGHIAFDPDPEILRAEHEKQLRREREARERRERVERERLERERIERERLERERIERTTRGHGDGAKTGIFSPRGFSFILILLFLAYISFFKKDHTYSPPKELDSTKLQEDINLSSTKESSLVAQELLRQDDALRASESVINGLELDAVVKSMSPEDLKLLVSSGNKKAILAQALELATQGYDEALQAFSKIKKLADTGFSPAQFFTSQMYYNATGTELDNTMGLAYLRESANSGYPRAMYDLGVRLVEGNGVKDNIKAAIKWLSLAKDAGSSEATILLDKLLIQSTPQSIQAIPSNQANVIRPQETQNMSPGGYSPDNAQPEAVYEAKFKGVFGITIEERLYPTEEMRENALELWASERKILEPDGTINEKHVVKQPESNSSYQDFINSYH